ncbi:MAG: YdcF family protein [Bryobacteraceae bacterium]
MKGSPGRVWKRPGVVVSLAALAIAAALLTFHIQILTAAGDDLVLDQAPRKSDIVVVLAGDQYGNRVLKAGELVKAGWAPYALVSGTPVLLANEADLNIAFAVAKGYPARYFRPFEGDTDSTRDETCLIAAELRRRGIRSVLLVTNNYHTRRAGALMRKAAPFLTIVTVAAPDRYFTPNGWWKTRGGQRIFLYEWLKTFSAWVGN